MSVPPLLLITAIFFVGGCWTKCHNLFTSCIPADEDTEAQEICVSVKPTIQIE